MPPFIPLHVMCAFLYITQSPFSPRTGNILYVDILNSKTRVESEVKKKKKKRLGKKPQDKKGERF